MVDYCNNSATKKKKNKKAETAARHQLEVIPECQGRPTDTPSQLIIYDSDVSDNTTIIPASYVDVDQGEKHTSSERELSEEMDEAASTSQLPVVEGVTESGGSIMVDSLGVEMKL